MDHDPSRPCRWREPLIVFLAKTPVEFLDDSTFVMCFMASGCK